MSPSPSERRYIVEEAIARSKRPGKWTAKWVLNFPKRDHKPINR